MRRTRKASSIVFGSGRLRASVLVAASAILLLASDSALAHEGHAALPTKGASVKGDTVYLSPDARKAVGVTTAEVDLKDLEHTLTVNASVVAPWKQHAFVTTKIGGRITEVLHRAGDRVEAGMKIAELESLELANEQLELIQYNLELDLAQKTVARLGSLREGTVPGKELIQARNVEREKRSALEITRAKLHGLGLREEALAEVLRSREPVRILSIVAPIDGIIAHGDVNPGRIVEPTDHLFEIVDLTTVWVKGLVVESESYRVRQGQMVRVVIAGLPDLKFEGSIDYVALQADPESRSLPIWVSLQNRDVENPALRPGMFGSVEIVTDRLREAVVCPTTALLTAGAESYVFVEQALGEYLRKTVAVGLRTSEWVEIKDGVFPGDRVVLNGSQQLSTFFVQGVLAVTSEARRNIGLVVAPVGRRSMDNVVTVNATIEVPPDKRTFASSQLPGKVTRILVDLAQPVKRGQPLAEIESLAFQELQLSLLQTQARLDSARRLLEAARQSQGSIAQQQLLERETDYRKLENELQIIGGKLRMLGLAPHEVESILETRVPLLTLPVRAALDGLVVNFAIIPGQVVKAGDPLFEVHDLSHVWVRGHVFQRDLPQVGVGQTVRVRVASDPAYLVKARLVRTSAVLGSSERVLSIWAELENQDQKLKNNMLAQITVSTGTLPPTVALPLSAVLHDGDQSHVFVQRPDQTGRFDRRPVETGKRDDQFVEVKSGLKPGELVAIQGVRDLQTAFASVK